MRGGVASPGAIGVAGLVPGLEGIDVSLRGEGNVRAARIIGPSSEVVFGVLGGRRSGCRRAERDRSDCGGVGGLTFGVGGVYEGESCVCGDG